MGKFSKIKKYSKPSLSVNEKIDQLNKELRKTGMLSEVMTTDSLYPQKETQPYIPPTISDVPDTSGITGNSFTQPTNGGIEGDASTWDNGWVNNDYLKNATELDGETGRGIVRTVPNSPYGGGGAGMVLTSYAFGVSVGYITGSNEFKQILSGGLIGGTNNPDTPNARSPLSGGNYGGLTDAEYNYAVAFWRAYQALATAYGGVNNIPTKTIQVWRRYNRFHDFQRGGEFETWTGGPKKTVNDIRYILTNVAVITAPQTYTSNPGQQQILVSRRAGDPEYSPLPGTILSMLNKSRLSKEAFRSLVAGYGLRPDGTMGFSKVGDKNKGNDGREYELVPRPGYGYNQWVPVKQASAGSDTQIAGGYGTGGLIDIDDKGWYVTPDQLLKMHQNPSRYNLTPRDQKKIKSWVTNLKLAHFEPQGELISEDRKKILPEKLQHIDFDEITDLEEFGKALSASQLIMLEKNLLKYIEENPEQIEALRKRYPISDSRLSELNYKLDKMVGASDEYLETQFPQNQKLFNKVQETIKKNIKLTDPKNFKTIKDPVTYGKLLSVGYVNQNEKPKKKLRLQNRNKETAARFLKKARIKTNQEVIDDKIKQLDLDMKKTMGNSREKK